MAQDTALGGRVELALVTGLISLVLAIVSGLLAYVTARANFRRDLEKMQAQIDAQREVTERERIADLRQRYVTPLRYYAATLGHRLSELDGLLSGPDAGRVRAWFKILKDHVTGDLRRSDFGVWPYYEGVFAITTLYYTCTYFQCAREIRYSLPFLRDNSVYSERLGQCLTRVCQSFYWDGGEQGIWDALQEIIGERFSQGKTTYEGLLDDVDAADAHRRGPYLRPLDFYWTQLGPDRAREIRGGLDALVAFLDSTDPRNRTGALR